MVTSVWEFRAFYKKKKKKSNDQAGGIWNLSPSLSLPFKLFSPLPPFLQMKKFHNAADVIDVISRFLNQGCLTFFQVELTGSSIFDFVHQGDHTELAEELGMKLPPRLCGVDHTKKEDMDSVPSSPTVPSPTASHGRAVFVVGKKLHAGHERSQRCFLWVTCRVRSTTVVCYNLCWTLCCCMVPMVEW